MDAGPRTLFHVEYSAMPKWTMAPVHFHYVKMDDDEMDDGPRTLSRWRNGRWPPYAFSFWKFLDDKMDVSLRTLFLLEVPVHFTKIKRMFLYTFGSFSMTKWTLVSVHFFILEVSRWQKGCWSLYTLQPPRTHTTVLNQKNICVFLW